MEIEPLTMPKSNLLCEKLFCGHIGFDMNHKNTMILTLGKLFKRSFLANTAIILSTQSLICFYSLHLLWFLISSQHPFAYVIWMCIIFIFGH